jgi:histidinol-phosphatase (PHP family)
LIDEVVEAAASCDVAIEINANALLWSQLYQVADGDPFDVLLKSIVKHHAAITIGSDAHKPEFVGKSFDTLRDILRSAGIKTYRIFTAHTPLELALP